MGILNRHDLIPVDARVLTNGEIEASILHATERMRGYVAVGEPQLAGVCERARDRMLDALSARINPT